MRMLTKPKSATGALFVVLVIVVALVAAIAVMRGGDNALAAPAYVEPVPATGEVHEYRLVAALTPGSSPMRSRRISGPTTAPHLGRRSESLMATPSE